MEILDLDSMNNETIEALKQIPASQLDIQHVRKSIHEMGSSLENIAKKLDDIKTHKDEIPPNCPAIKLEGDAVEFKEELKNLAETVKKNSLVFSRNGKPTKDYRPLVEVVAETHEAIYFMKGFGLFMLSLMDFVKNNRVIAVCMFLVLLFFHDPVFDLTIAVIEKPGEWGKSLIKTLQIDNSKKVAVKDSVKTDTLKAVR